MHKSIVELIFLSAHNTCNWSKSIKQNKNKTHATIDINYVFDKNHLHAGLSLAQDNKQALINKVDQKELILFLLKFKCLCGWRGAGKLRSKIFFLRHLVYNITFRKLLRSKTSLLMTTTYVFLLQVIIIRSRFKTT